MLKEKDNNGITNVEIYLLTAHFQGPLVPSSLLNRPQPYNYKLVMYNYCIEMLYCIALHVGDRNKYCCMYFCPNMITLCVFPYQLSYISTYTIYNARATILLYWFWIV